MKLQDTGRITLGTCYYPEHWKESEWKGDLLRMLENGIETVRVAEFAWSLIEKREGEFDFTFFDRFLDVAEEVGMKVIFCTPTATPPAWLTEKYPEVLNADKNGVLYRHGSRRHYNYSAPVYRELSARITEQSAAHYAKRPCIIGWQLDNEYNCELQKYYAEADTVAFREYLKAKYGTLDALNDAWGTVFWNQTYTSWDEVYVPRPTPSGFNPHQELDFTRFIAGNVGEYSKIQADILKKHIKSGDFITHNGIFGNIDYQKMVDDQLDFITYDSYPCFPYTFDSYSDADDFKDRRWSKNLTEVRSISPVFGIMEQQSGPGGSMARIMPAPKPGQLTLWTMQSIAHGANFVSYFRWRTCTFGAEIYWHGILDYSGRDNRRLKEVKAVGELLKNFDAVSDTRYEAKIALLKDHDNVWDAQCDVWHRTLDWASEDAFFRACQKSHTPLDFCYLDHASAEDLAKYDLLVFPHPVIMTAEKVSLLEEYVRNGGALLVGARAGYKDENGHCVTDKLPGLLTNLLGADIPEYTAINPELPFVPVRWGEKCLPSVTFNDLLEPLEGAELVGHYDGNYYKGAGALVRHPFGNGTAYTFGGGFADETADAFLEAFGVKAPFDEVIDLPADCELAVREGNGERFLFVLNYTAEERVITLKKAATLLADNTETLGEVTVEPFGTRVYKLSR